MTAFASAEDLRRYVGGVFEIALADGDLGPKLTGTGLVLRIVTTDPDATITIDLPNKEVVEGEGTKQPDATMSMSSDIANRFWQGKVNLPVAMARGQVKVDGRMASLLKLVPSTKKLFPAYLELLQRDNRQDLIAEA